MSNVSANIGANTQQAESSIGRLLASLRKLRQESATGVGMKMFASDEVNKLSSALNQAIAAAGALNKLDLSQFDSSLRRSAELLKRNADNYLRAQQAMGNQGVAGRFAQHLGAGGNPLNPDFGKMFPGMQGAALQRQMDYYFKSMLRGTGMSGSYSGGGGRGGTTGHGGAAPGGGGEGDGGANTAILAGLGKMFAPILAAVSVGKLVSSGLAAARRNTEAEDTLMRMTRDGGTGAGIGRAGLRMDNQVGSLSEHFEFVGKRYGLSGTEAMQSAQVYAHAAQQNDRQDVAHGLNASAGFARAYGLNINQTAGGLGGLQRTGAIGSTPAAQNEFLLKMAQTLKSTGMTANADQAIDDLAQTVDQYISHDLATPSAGKLDEFAALRAVTYTMPGLSGKHGQNLLGQFDDNMRSDSNDARNIMMATALQRYGIEDPYAVQAIQAEGANFDLSTVPGSTAKPGMTYGQLAAEEAHRIATDASGGTTGDPRADYNRRAMERVVQANLLGMPITGAQVPYEIYQQREKDKAKLVDSKAQLAQYGLTPESFTNTSGVKDAVDLMGMDNPEEVREVAKRYADRLDMTGAGGAARADINKLLEDANSDPEAIKKRTLEAIAQFGQHGSQTTTDRASQAEQDNALNATGRVFMDEWNTTVETGAIALKDFARSTDGAKKALDAFKDWLNALTGTTPTRELPLGHTQPPEGGLPVDLPLMPGETQAERDAGGDAAPLRPFGSPPPGTGGGTPTPLGPPLASTTAGNPLLDWFFPPANADTTYTPTTGWNTSPGTLPTDDCCTKNNSPLTSTGNVPLTEWNKLLMIGAKALDGFAEVSGDLVESFEDSLIPSVMTLSREAMNAAGYLKELYRGESEYSLLEREGALDEQGNLLPSATPEQRTRYQDTQRRQQSSTGGATGGARQLPPDIANTSHSGPAPAGSPRSWKNNNPGNLRGQFYGATGNEGGFATYATPQAGWDAMEKQLFRYYEGKTTGKPLQTVGDIIKTWAPAADGNNPGRYAAEVAGSLGVGVDDKIDINDEDFRHRLMGKIAGYEAGRLTPYGSNLGRSDTPSSGAAPGPLRPSRPAKPTTDSGAKTAAQNIPPPPKPDVTPAADTGTAATQPSVPADTGAATPAATAEAAATAPADTGAAQPDVPADTGSPAGKATADTGAAASKGGASATPGVDVPEMKDVPPTEKTQTPEEAAAQAAKDVDAARQAAAASVPSNRRKVGEQAANASRTPDAEAASAKARAQQGLPPLPTNDRPDWKQNPDTTATGAPDAKAAAAASAKARAQQGLPPLPTNDRPDFNSAPGDMPVDPQANATIGAPKAKDFGTLAVNVNHTKNGALQYTESRTLKAGSGGADNSVKGAVNISPENVA